MRFSFYLALLVTAVSYNGGLQFYLTADGKLCQSESDMEIFRSFISEELEELASSTKPYTSVTIV